MDGALRKVGIIMLVTTFSGSKGGVGKTTLAISVSIVSALQRIPTLLVDASSEGGATAYLLGNVEPPYLSAGDLQSALRRVAIQDVAPDSGVELNVAVNRGPLRDVARVAEQLRSLDSFPVVIADVPALSDLDAMERYLPLLEAADAVLTVAEPSTASIRSAMYTFGSKRVVAALNCPRPYTQTVVDLYRRYMDIYARRCNAHYVVVPYSKAISLLSSERLNILAYVEPAFVSAVTELARLLFSKK
jgi:cellulose biosynthesis protein BcsQ